MKHLKFISCILILFTLLSVFSSCANVASDGISDSESESAEDVQDTGDGSNTGKTPDKTPDVPKKPTLVAKNTPIAYFSFDTVDKNGKFIDDISKFSCASVGTPSRSEHGKKNSCLLLDGSSYLSFNSSGTTLPTGNADHTVTAWIMIDRSMPATSDGVIAGWGQYRSLSDTRMLIFRNQFCVSSYSIYTAYTVPEQYKAQWLHFAMTYSDNTYRMYVNGTLLGAVKGNGTNIQKTDLFIGGFGSAGLNFMGAIDEVCIYDTALNNEEIVENMNGKIDYKSASASSATVSFAGADTPLVAGWNNMTYKGDTANVSFKMYIPKNYDKSKKYPIIMFMPGDGAIGKSIDEVIGGNESVYMNRCIIEGEDCICIVPSMPGKWLTVPNDTNTVYPYKDYSMSDARPSAAFNEIRNLFNECVNTLAVNKDRVYFIGYSRGTMAGFYWLANQPELFAGALLCCGASDPAAAANYKDVPIWMFIGDTDNLVSTDRFKAVYDSYAAAGGKGKFTFFQGGTHSLKSYLISEAGVVEWLMSQSKSK